MSSSPLIYVRDGRTLPFIPVTQASLNAIAAADAEKSGSESQPSRLAAARSVFLALLELAFEHHGIRVAISNRMLGDRAGVSRSIVKLVRPVLESAGVVEVNERRVGSHQIENEWVIVEPGDPASSEPPRPAANHPPASSEPPPGQQRTTARAGVPPAVKEEGEEGDASHPLSSAARVDGAGSSQTARELFEYWQATCGHPNAKPSQDRLSKIRARLREGYPPQQIRTAIEGAARAPYVNDNGQRFDDIELICRNASKLEAFIARSGQLTLAGVQPTRPISPAGRAWGPLAGDKYDQAAGLLAAPAADPMASAYMRQD